MKKVTYNNNEKEIGLSIVVPTHDEEGSVKSLIKSIVWAFVESRISYEIIVVDDHSTDKTNRIVQACSKHYPVRLVEKVGKVGKGYSVVQGFNEAMYQYIAVVDADAEGAVEMLPKLLELASVHGYASAHLHQSRLEKLLTRGPSRGPKIFRREIFEFLPQHLVSPWVVEGPLIHTANELGYKGASIGLDQDHSRRSKSPSERVRHDWQIVKSTIVHKLFHPIFPVRPTNTKSMLGAGVTYRHERFVTHTTLPPDRSAIQTFLPWQTTLILGSLVVASIGFVLIPRVAAITITATLSAIYLADVVFNLWVTLKSLHFPPEITVSGDRLHRLRDTDLPLYSVLCPLYKEARVLPQFVEAMKSLDWPEDRLEVLLLLEEDDTVTIDAARAMKLPGFCRIVVVPDSHPKTKPKACNYGLAVARGEYVVIYDAEDQPDPLQLKKAYLVFNQSGANVACLQAKLNYYNPHHNLLTRLFTAEYSLWFDVILPGLQSIRTTIPLGGTSNHFRTGVLRELEGWDPFNVTEDADLGTRLFSAGYQTAVIESTTLEEANSDLKNWFRQRSRWLKGYMQTYLVHMREPKKLFKDQGIHAFLFQLIVGGKIAFILINPFLWLMTIAYFVLYHQVGAAIESIYPAPVFYMAVISLVVGNFVALYNYMIGCAKRGHWDLVKYVFVIPLYWLGISVAAGIGLFQLVFRPHYWEKTIHGLHLIHADKMKAAALSRGERGKRVQRFVDWASSGFAAGGVMVAASLFANFMNFVYNAYLGRQLNLADFGMISLFGSFLALTSVPISALGRAVTHTSAFLLGKYKTPVKELWSDLRARVFRYSLYAMAIWVLATPLLQQFFQVKSWVPFLLFAPVWIVDTVSAVDGGFLNGSLFFILLAVTGVLESVVKFALAAVFINLKIPGYVYAAIPLSMTVTFFVGWWQISRLKPHRIEIENKVRELKLSTHFFWTSILTTLTSAMYVSLDVVLAKHDLSPEAAGAYGYISLAGKMVFFLGSIFSQFLVPFVSRDIGAGRHPRRSFITIFSLVAIVNAAAWAIFGLLGRITAPLLWGSHASLIVPYLPMYALAMAFFSLTSLIVTYQQVQGRYAFPVVAFILSALEVVGMFFEHGSIGAIVDVVTITSLITFACVAVFSLFYDQLVDVYHASFDLVGLFRPLSTSEPLAGGKLRILIFNWRDLRHRWAGGAETYLHELASRWVKMGNEVTIFSGSDGKSPRHETVAGVNIIRRGGFYLVYFWAYLYYTFRLRGRYDVIIDSENGIPFFTPLYAKEKVFLLIHHVHQEVFRTSLRPPFSWIAMLLESRLMPIVYKNTEVLTVSPSSKAEILLHRLTRHDPTVLYNGVNLNVCKPGKKSAEPSVLYLGRLTSVKSVQVLIRATRKIMETVPRVHVTIAGDGPYRKTLVRLARTLGLEDVITFTGKVTEEEKVGLYQKAWVFVNPSLIEGWGITTIEANACGTPVVASNVAGLRDSVKNPHSGVLVPYGNVDEFASAVTNILTHTPMRSRMSKESVAWAKKFDWEESAEKGLAILKGAT